MVDLRPPAAREAAAAAALTVGSTLGLAVMLWHPTGRDLIAGGAQVVHRNQVVHGAAIAAIAVQTFGTLGITRRVRRASLGLAEFAQTSQACAAVAGSLAAVASGFLAPQLVELSPEGPKAELWRLNFHANQVFAGIYGIASAVAATAWSLAGRSGGLPQWVCAFGSTAAPLVAVLIATGHVRLDVHGLGAVLLGQCVWMLGSARALWRAQAAPGCVAP